MALEKNHDHQLGLGVQTRLAISQRHRYLAVPFDQTLEVHGQLGAQLDNVKQATARDSHRQAAVVARIMLRAWSHACSKSDLVSM